MSFPICHSDLEMQCPECEAYNVKVRTLRGKEYGICDMCWYVDNLDMFYPTAMEKLMKRKLRTHET
jgi:hypothetical protein